MTRRVAVTGIGALTPIGFSSQGLWCGLLAGRSAVGQLRRFDASPFRTKLAAEIEDFEPLDWMDRKSAKRLDRFAQFGVAAAQQAVEDASLCIESIGSDRIGVSIGSALGGVAFGEAQRDLYTRHGLRGVSASVATSVYGGASGANIAIELNLRGPNLANANSCASGAVAIGEGARLIERGDADIMLAGGVEAPLAPLTFGSFALIKAMSTRNDDPDHASRPFDEARDGFVMAEGAGLLVLEEYENAVVRGAHIYCELVGYGHTNDGYNMTAPRPDGSEAGRAMSLALRDAGIEPDAVGYINAHATGTPLGDMAESRAILRAFGEYGRQVPVSGTKGLYGHALGASGAIEAAITAMVLEREFLPGTANLERKDDDCALNILPPAGTMASPRYAVSTAFGFGGSNAALVLAHVAAAD